MSDQCRDIVETLRQWARDFSTDEDRDVFVAAADEIASLRARLASARKALEPFANAADGLNPRLPDSFEVLFKIDATPFGYVRAGDLRTAKAALTDEHRGEG